MYVVYAVYAIYANSAIYAKNANSAETANPHTPGNFTNVKNKPLSCALFSNLELFLPPKVPSKIFMPMSKTIGRTTEN
ncbi:hypothetical protein DRN43_02350 [Thermococci archaeon]|nr:MAG: hypothetical protein DRN43_02350 [Thermococci archaeon]